MAQLEADPRLLPGVPAAFDEGFRLDVVQGDLAMIADRATEQVAVHQYATQATAEVLHTTATLDVPNKEAIGKLLAGFESGETEALDWANH